MTRFFISLSVLLFFASAASAGESIDDAALGFRLNLPNGFVPQPPSIRNRSDCAYAFELFDERDRTLANTIEIQKFEAPAKQSRLRQEHVPADSDIVLSSAIWQGIEIDVVEDRGNSNGEKLIFLTAIVPLRKQKIHLIVAGKLANEQRTRDLLNEVLENLRGDTNWALVEPAIQEMPLEQLAGRVVAVVGLVFLAIGAGIFFFWRFRSSPDPIEAVATFPSAVEAQVVPEPPSPRA